jgi:hypothetical protein
LRYRRLRIGVLRTLRKTNRRQGDPIMSNHKQADADLLLREIENGISAAFAQMFSGVDEMNSKPNKIPGPDHPITITPTKGRITVVVTGKRVADTREALTLKEAAYPAVQYIPRKDSDAPREDGLDLLQEIRQVRVIGVLFERGENRLVAKALPRRGRTQPPRGMDQIGAGRRSIPGIPRDC